MQSVVCNIAGIKIRYNAVLPLTFSKNAEQFRGFGTSSDEPVDFTIEVKDATTDRPKRPEIVASLVGKSSEETPIPYRWKVFTTAQGEEGVMVNLYENTDYEWMQVVLSETNGVFELRRRPRASTAIDPYQFPLFNLMLSRLLLRRKGVLAHSSVVDDNGNGYLFTAVSGTGKSTMATLWQSCGATVVNDDMLALMPNENSIEAHNIPMSYYSATPNKTSLKAIFLISQSPENFIRKLHGASAVLRFASNTIHQPLDKHSVCAHLSIVDNICQKVPVFELGFKPDIDIIYEIKHMFNGD